MKAPAKRIARLGILSALGTVLLFLTAVIPSGRIGLMVLASFPVCIAVMMYGCGWAVSVYVVSAGLGALLFPSAAVWGFALFFGWYPILKSLCEHLRRLWLVWVCKYGLYLAAFAACWFLASGLFSGTVLPWYALLPIGAAAFAVYDYCYSLAIRFYLQRVKIPM